VPHTTLVFTTSLLRNLNHIYASRDDSSWIGFGVFAISMVIVAVGWVWPRRSREVLQRHHMAVRALLAHYRGKEIDTIGDGFFASFDGPARAVRFSPEMKEADLDWESITAIIQEGEQGKIVEVEDEEHHKTVEVWVE
jgi:hypothetical protein